MSDPETQKNETHPIIDLIKTQCKNLGVKAEQIQRLTISEEEDNKGPQYFWSLSVPGMPQPFNFNLPGDVANALMLGSTLVAINELKHAEKVEIKDEDPKIEFHPLNSKEEVDQAVKLIEEDNGKIPEPGNDVPIHIPSTNIAKMPDTPVIGAMSFEERQKVRQQNAGRPGRTSTFSSNKSPVVSAGRTSV